MQKARYVGIDIGKEKSVFCALNEEQEQISLVEFRHTLHDYEHLKEYLCPCTRIVIEPTGSYCVNLFLYFMNAGYQIRFADTKSSNHTLRSETNGIKKKTDRLDAKGLALHSVIHWKKCKSKIPYLDNVWSYSNTLFYIRMKELLQQHAVLSKDIVRVMNKIEILIKLRFPELQYIFKKPCSKLAMKFMCLEEQDYSYPAEEIARFIGAAKNYYPQVKDMKSYMGSSLALQTGLFFKKAIETKQLVRELSILEEERNRIEDRLAIIIKSTHFSKLYEFKGLNTITITKLLTEIRDIKRFLTYHPDGSIDNKKSLKSFRKFCGFVVTSNQSGNRQGQGVLAKCNHTLRNLFFMMALTYISMKENPVKDYYNEKAKKMTSKKAVIRTACHLSAEIFFKIKDLRWDDQAFTEVEKTQQSMVNSMEDSPAQA